MTSQKLQLFICNTMKQRLCPQKVTCYFGLRSYILNRESAGKPAGCPERGAV